MSAKAIIELASGQGPPNALAQRDERVVRATDVFVDSIRDLKASQQYVLILRHISFSDDASLQKATYRREDLQGRFFAVPILPCSLVITVKLFKAKASDARSLSARTIRLLDEEDLRSLMHLCEEYPDVSFSHTCW